MGTHIKRALNYVTVPTNPTAFWGIACPVGIGTLLCGVILGVASLDLISKTPWQWPSWAAFRYCFAIEGPLLLLAGAMAQTWLASLRSRNYLKKPAPEAERKQDRLDLLGWGLVTTGALLSFLATFPWSLPAGQ